jgi:hypothetical protein
VTADDRARKLAKLQEYGAGRLAASGRTIDAVPAMVDAALADEQERRRRNIALLDAALAAPDTVDARDDTGREVALRRLTPVPPTGCDVSWWASGDVAGLLVLAGRAVASDEDSRFLEHCARRLADLSPAVGAMADRLIGERLADLDADQRRALYPWVHAPGE